jgi:hypothetical protein
MSITTSGRTCPTCGRVGSAARRFCGGCRTKLARVCAICGFANELDDHWCGGCAGALPAAAANKPAKVAAKPAPAVVAMPARPTSVVPAAAAALLAVNRARAKVASAAVVEEVRDQDELDALFGGDR